MPIDFGHHGLEYTHDLCTAIEQYTAQHVLKNPQAFKYRGVELRYAVERWLYIQCINSEALFDHYMAQYHGNDVQSKLPNLKGYESDIAFLLSSIKPPIKQSVKRRVRWLLKIARRTWDRLSQRKVEARTADLTVQEDLILIQVVNVKFAKYLEPVLDELVNGSYSFLNTNDAKLGEQLSELGYAAINRNAQGSDCQPIFSYALTEFIPLMQVADALLVALRELKPASVAVVEGNAPSDAITSEACRLLNIPCYCIQHGWSPYVHNGFRNMNFTEMFIWGPRFAEILRPYNPNLSFRITGTHIAKTSYLLPARKRVVTLSFFLQAPCALLGAEAFNAFVDLIIEVAKTHPEIKVIVRNHPNYQIPPEFKEKLAAYHNLHFSVPAAEPLADVLAQSDLVISIFSTILLEALAMGVAPLICSIGAMQKYEPDIASYGAAIEVHSVAEALQAIDNLIAEPERLAEIKNCIRKISDNFFSKDDGAKLIANHLQSVVETAGY